MRTSASAVRATAHLDIMKWTLVLFFLAFLPPRLAAEPAQGSLYELASMWKDQKGQAFTLKDVQGKVVLVSMVYTSCQQTCPLIISEMAALQKALPPELQTRVEVLLFSLDPKRDTPERLAAFARERKINPAWRLLHGSEDDVLELATVLGFRYKKMESGDFAHSNIFTVLDGKGQMKHQQLELFKDRAQTVAVMQGLLKTP